MSLTYKKVGLYCVFIAIINSSYSQKNCSFFIDYEKIDFGIEQNKIDSLKLILVGETHYNWENEFIFNKILSSLQSNSKKFNIIIEGGPSEAIILNEFLRTGNDTLLKKIRKTKEEIYYWNKNRSLINQNSKIIGIDYERKPEYFISALTILGSTDSALLQFKLINQFVKDDYKIYYPTPLKFWVDVKLNEFFDNFKKDTLIKKNINEETLSKIETLQEYYSFYLNNPNEFTSSFDIYREELLSSSLNNILNNNEKTLYLFKVGRSHILDTTYFLDAKKKHPINPMYNRVKDEYKKNVLRLQIIYNNKKQLRKDADYLNIDYKCLENILNESKIKQLDSNKVFLISNTTKRLSSFFDMLIILLPGKKNN